MLRIDDPSAAPTLPAPEVAGTEGYFTEGSPGVTQPTLVRASFLNMVQEELRSVVVAAGLTPSKTTYNQVLSAIKALVQQSVSNYALDTGVANAYRVAYVPAVTAVIDGMVLKFRAKFANTGASTFAPNGMAATPIWGGDHAAIGGGEIVANGDVWLQWNSALNGGVGAWMLIDSTGGFLKSPTPAASDNSTKLATTGWFYNAIATVATAAGFVASLTSNGYIKFPSWLGGLIIQWGVATIGASTTLSMPLNIAFPSAFFCVFSAAQQSTLLTSSAYSPANAPSGLASFVMQNTYTSALLVGWFAIGK